MQNTLKEDIGKPTIPKNIYSAMVFFTGNNNFIRITKKQQIVMQLKFLGRFFFFWIIAKIEKLIIYENANKKPKEKSYQRLISNNRKNNGSLTNCCLLSFNTYQRLNIDKMSKICLLGVNPGAIIVAGQPA